jgi:hypothetical protein
MSAKRLQSYITSIEGTIYDNGETIRGAFLFSTPEKFYNTFLSQIK